MDISKVPAHVMRDLRETVKENNLVRDRSDASVDAYIASLSPKEVFEYWLEWNGICRWADTIWDVAEALRR